MSGIARYAPVGDPVWAVQWEESNVAEVLSLVDSRFFNRVPPDDPRRNQGFTAEVYDYLHASWIGVKPGDWIIRGSSGECYPHDGTLFPARYRKVEE